MDINIYDAAEKGDLEGVKKALDAGADIDACLEYSGTALMHAASMGRLKVVQYLLDAGADPNVGNADATTALMCAAWNNKFNVARLLIKNGANINVKSRDGSTALEEAAYRGQVETVRLLLKSGANFNLASDYGITALSRTEAQLEEQIKNGGYEKEIKRLQETVDVLKSWKEVSHPMEDALKAKRLPNGHLTKENRQKIIDAKKLSPHGQTIHRVAFDTVFPGYREGRRILAPSAAQEEGLPSDKTLEKMLEKDARPKTLKMILQSIQEVEEFGNDRLTESAKKGFEEPVQRAFIQHGAKDLEHLYLFKKLGVDLEKHGEDALLSAFEKQNVATINLLLSRGVNPNIKSKKDIPIIVLAAGRGNLEVVEALLRYRYPRPFFLKEDLNEAYAAAINNARNGEDAEKIRDLFHAHCTHGQRKEYAQGLLKDEDTKHKKRSVNKSLEKIMKMKASKKKRKLLRASYNTDPTVFRAYMAKRCKNPYNIAALTKGFQERS